ncbi:hypothetical protein FRB98_008248 [Tulasnella sp. 332]|nr:hypothetical protein FRB98_008248 [Tulasnella sp. 332]
MASTGLSVFCVLWHLAYANSGVNSDPDLSLTSVTFTLDGNPAGNFSSGPYVDITSTSYSYNTSIYANFNMSNGPHTFSINLEPNSMILFDYAVIYQNGSSSSNIQLAPGKAIATAAIVGVCIGAGIVLLSTLVIFLIRRRRRQARKMFFDIDDGHIPNPSSNIAMQKHQGSSGTYQSVGTLESDPFVISDNQDHARQSRSNRITSPPSKGRHSSLSSGTRLMGGLETEYSTVEVEDDAEDVEVLPDRLPPPYKSRPQVKS